MSSQSKQDRFDSLCARNRQSSHADAVKRHRMDLESSAVRSGTGKGGIEGRCLIPLGYDAMLKTDLTAPDHSPKVYFRVPPEATAEIQGLEAEIASLRRLLADTRQNTAAMVCNEIRQFEKGHGYERGQEFAANSQ